MARKIRIEAPEDLTLTLYMYPFSSSGTPDVEGYASTEAYPRAYESTITDDTLYGVFYCVWKYTAGDEEITIDSGYCNFELTDGTYLVTNEPPTETTSVVTEVSPTYSSYGPKRVKTKEMEIEQFDPIAIQRATERSSATLPSFADGNTAVGRGKRCRHIGPNNY